MRRLVSKAYPSVVKRASNVRFHHNPNLSRASCATYKIIARDTSAVISLPTYAALAETASMLVRGPLPANTPSLTKGAQFFVSRCIGHPYARGRRKRKVVTLSTRRCTCLCTTEHEGYLLTFVCMRTKSDVLQIERRKSFRHEKLSKTSKVRYCVNQTGFRKPGLPSHDQIK